jgi:predicted Zn finger-like uncharacterized protein
MKISCESCQSTFYLDSRLLESTGTRLKCSKCQEIFKVYPAESIDQRKNPRVKTNNLVSYFSLDGTGKLISHGIGIALDISKGGILLETPFAIESGLIVLATLDRKNTLIEVNGKLVYFIKKPLEMYLSGIEFIDTDKRVAEFIVNLVKGYNYRRYNLFIAIGQKIKDLRCHLIVANQ